MCVKRRLYFRADSNLNANNRARTQSHVSYDIPQIAYVSYDVLTDDTHSMDQPPLLQTQKTLAERHATRQIESANLEAIHQSPIRTARGSHPAHNLLPRNPTPIVDVSVPSNFSSQHFPARSPISTRTTAIHAYDKDTQQPAEGHNEPPSISTQTTEISPHES